MEGGPAGVIDTGGAGATTGGAGATGGVVGGASLPLFNIQIPTKRSEIRVLGRRSSSKSSM
jgi:hypothetical protein